MGVALSPSWLLQNGQLLADYEILDPAGRGGMGIVYRARQRSLGRVVALKVISEEIANQPEYRERFLREARLAAAVDHPHIVSVHDVGEANGHLFLAMQWVEGQDLKRILESAGRLAAERAVAIAAQIAGALDAVHNVGLVHRDVKPANVLLRDVGGDHAYLTDFGVAKPSETADQLTCTGWVVGTSGYLSPEQIRGQEPGPRSDLYGLACLFFEILTGMAPFMAQNEMALRWAHANDPRPLVSTVVPRLGLRYDRFITVALAVDPAQRFGSGREFAEALAAAHAGHGHVAAVGNGHVAAVGNGHVAAVGNGHFAAVGQSPLAAAPVIPVPHTPTAVGPPTPIPPAMQTPPPGPVYPAYAYPTPVPPYPERSRSGSPLALILLALTALAGIAAGVLAVAGVFSRPAPLQPITRAAARSAPARHSSSTHPVSTPSQPTSSTPAAGTQTNASTPPDTSGPSSTQNLADPGAPISGSAPGAALQAYWTLVNTGHYRKAWMMETPNEQGQEPSFISDKKTAQPMINVVSIGQPSSSSGSADVPIVFYAQDRYPSPGSDTTCRYFQMTAHMVQGGNGGWYYDGPVSGSAQVTTESGNPNCHS